jgi:RsiW-degrading membrane proteinase PrsW (M82 family)
MYGTWVLLLIILISSVPVIAVYLWFRLARYPIKLINFLFALLAGAAALFPAFILQGIFNFSFTTKGRAELFYHVFFRIAFTEELSRLLMLLIFFWFSDILVKNISNQSVSPATVKKGAAIGLVAGLGFALLENAIFAACSNLNVLLQRTVTVILHAACSSRVGIAAVLLRSNPVQAFFKVLTATAIHGIFNLMVKPGLPLMSLPSIIAILIVLSALTTSISTITGSWEDTPQQALDKTETNQ